MVDRQKMLQIFQPEPLSEILTTTNFYTTRAGFAPAQNLSSGFAKRSRVALITTTMQRH